MIVNGMEIALGEACTLLAFLDRGGYDAARVAVEKNGEIVSKSSFDSEMLCDGDKLEIVAFIGGG